MGMKDQIRIVIADDHRLFREGIRLMLSKEEDMQIVGETVNGLQTVNMVSDLKPDVVLLDITMAEMNGIQIIPPIREKSPTTKALMLAAAVDEAMIFKSLKAGAKGYLSKDSNASELFKAIRAVHRGEMWIGRKFMSRFFDQEAIDDSKRGNSSATPKEELTQREQEILRHLTRGCTNKEIAQDLFISEKTVKTHLNSIFRKLKVTRRLQAILCAINKGLSQ
jgi:NarL family two-component system response regulator LiaR